MAIGWIQRVWASSKATGSAYAVLVGLAYHANSKDGGRCYPSIDELAAGVRLSRRTVINALRELERLGEIERTGEHKGRTVVYRLTAPPLQSAGYALSEADKVHDVHSQSAGYALSEPKVHDVHSESAGYALSEADKVHDVHSQSAGYALSEPKVHDVHSQSAGDALSAGRATPLLASPLPPPRPLFPQTPYTPTPPPSPLHSSPPSSLRSDGARATPLELVGGLNGADANLLDLNLPDPADEMVAAWNAMATELGLPVVQRMTPTRRAKALARRRDLGGIDGWHDCLNKIRGSPLLRGEAKDWRATFDWVLEPRNLTKIMEGNYDDRSSGRAKDRRGGAVDDGRRRELALGAVEALGGHDGRWSASKGRA